MELQEMFRYGYLFPPQEDVVPTYLELPSYSYLKEKSGLPPVTTLTAPGCAVYDNNSDGWHTPSPAASLRSISPTTTSVSSESESGVLTNMRNPSSQPQEKRYKTHPIPMKTTEHQTSVQEPEKMPSSRQSIVSNSSSLSDRMDLDILLFHCRSCHPKHHH